MDQCIYCLCSKITLLINYKGVKVIFSVHGIIAYFFKRNHLLQMPPSRSITEESHSTSQKYEEVVLVEH